MGQFYLWLGKVTGSVIHAHVALIMLDKLPYGVIYWSRFWDYKGDIENTLI